MLRVGSSFKRNASPGGVGGGPGPILTVGGQPLAIWDWKAPGVAPGAMATQREYGVPAAVTIAQAIDESGWGKSELAVEAHNLFGIKGTGPAGSVTMPTTEYEDGAWVTIDAAFRYGAITKTFDAAEVLNPAVRRPRAGR